jgi:hypothetical protein
LTGGAIPGLCAQAPRNPMRRACRHFLPHYFKGP